MTRILDIIHKGRAKTMTCADAERLLLDARAHGHQQNCTCQTQRGARWGCVDLRRVLLRSKEHWRVVYE